MDHTLAMAHQPEIRELDSYHRRWSVETQK